MNIETLLNEFAQNEETTALAAFVAIFVIQNRIHTAFDKVDHEITMRQFQLLIMAQNVGADATLSELSELLGCSRQNVKNLAMSLEKKGFVSLVENKDDARKKNLQINQAKMRDYHIRVNEKHGKLMATLFMNLSRDELSNYFKLNLKILEGVKAMETL